HLPLLLLLIVRRPTWSYPLSLHDALPIWVRPSPSGQRWNRPRPSNAPQEANSIRDGSKTRSMRACHVKPYSRGLVIDWVNTAPTPSSSPSSTSSTRRSHRHQEGQRSTSERHSQTTGGSAPKRAWVTRW